jgi:ADP-ribosylglycohydrolase
MNARKSLMIERAKNALQALFIGDSMAMPVHWYYKVSDIYKEFPNGIFQFEDAPAYHPSSIMSMHSKQQGGRKYLNKKQQKNIVGDVILKGKGKYWGQSNIHYHHGMKAGDNTLNAHCARVLFQTLISTDGKYHRDVYLQNYISMMTSDIPQHKDTYAESYHRGFFANYIKNRDIFNCGAVTHDTASVGGLVSIGPLAIALFLSGYDLIFVQSQCTNHLLTTHPDQLLIQVCNEYVALIEYLLHRDKSQDCFEIILNYLNNASKSSFNTINFNKIVDSSIVGGKFSTACYITDSWPSVLYLAGKYRNDLISGLISNANLGGDNVHRGAVLGTLLGLMTDNENIQISNWFSKLVEHDDINSEINYLLNFIE